MNRLETIAERQRRSRLRDLAFAAMIVLTGIASLVAIATTMYGAATIVQR